MSKLIQLPDGSWVRPNARRIAPRGQALRMDKETHRQSVARLLSGMFRVDEDRKEGRPAMTATAITTLSFFAVWFAIGHAGARRLLRWVEGDERGISR